MNKLPIEVQRKIFEYDSTFSVLYCECVKEIPDVFIAKEHERSYLGLFNNIENNSVIHFDIDAMSHSKPYLYLKYMGFSYIAHFNSITYITTEGVKRFIYEDNSTIEQVRLEGIDTRLRPWEWWMILTSYDNKDSVCLSCDYHQIHGYMIQVNNINSNSCVSMPIYIQDAKALNKKVRNEMLHTLNQHGCSSYFKDYLFSDKIGYIPNALHRYYLL